MRNRLNTEIINALYPHRDSIPFEEIKAQITIILDNYEISKRKTEVAVMDEGTNDTFIALFLASKAAGGRAETTLKAYRGYIKKILDTIGKNAQEVTADDVKLYLAKKLRVSGNKKCSVDNERRALSSFYCWMQKNEYIAKNPMDKVEIIKYAKAKKKAFTDYEVELIRNACQTERETIIVEMLLSTWCRVNELANIRISDIAGTECLVHGKGEKDRTVYLNAKARVAVERYLAKRKDSNPYLLPQMASASDRTTFGKGSYSKRRKNWYEDPDLVDPAEHSGKDGIERVVKMIGARAGVSDVHPHRFRRTGATMALKAGMPIITVSKLLGHANIAVTQLYLDITDEDLENEHSRFVR